MSPTPHVRGCSATRSPRARPDSGRRTGLRSRSSTRLRSVVGGLPVIVELPRGYWPLLSSRRRAEIGLGREHAGKPRDRGERFRRARRGEHQRRVLPVGPEEDRVDHEVDRIDACPAPSPSAPTENAMPSAVSAGAHRMARSGGGAPWWSAARRAAARSNDAAEELAIDGRRRRLHGDRGGQRERRAGSPESRRAIAAATRDAGGDQVDVGLDPEDQEREGCRTARTCTVMPRPSQVPATAPISDADGGDDQHELEVVPRDRHAGRSRAPSGGRSARARA